MAIPLADGLAARSWGAGPVVLLVHGWEGRSSQLGAFVDPVVAAGFRAIAVDAPAHGDSPGTGFTPVRYGRALLDVADTVGSVAGVISHSLGSSAVLSALHRGLRPARAAFVAPVRSYSDEIAKLARFYGLDPADFAGRVGSLFGRPVTELDPERWSARDPAALFCHDVSDRRIPVESTRSLAARWPGADLMESVGHGHYGILRSPAVVARVVEHLTGRPDA
jgi:pimeloyl-ACP methyl ester carboxylesterase